MNVGQCVKCSTDPVTCINNSLRFIFRLLGLTDSNGARNSKMIRLQAFALTDFQNKAFDNPHASYVSFLSSSDWAISPLFQWNLVLFWNSCLCMRVAEFLWSPLQRALLLTYFVASEINDIHIFLWAWNINVAAFRDAHPHIKLFPLIHISVAHSFSRPRTTFGHIWRYVSESLKLWGLFLYVSTWITVLLHRKEKSTILFWLVMFLYIAI